MKKLNHIVRFRLSDEMKAVLKDKNISKYVRNAVLEKMMADFPDKFNSPF